MNQKAVERNTAWHDQEMEFCMILEKLNIWLKLPEKNTEEN